MRSIGEMNIERLADDRKIEFYATINEDGMPHITAINSLFQLDEGRLAWAQMCAGQSKINQKARPNVAFLAYDEDGMMTLGHARFNHSEDGGDLMDTFNRIPRLRYNSYGGYSPVHVLDLLDAEPPRALAQFGPSREASCRAAGAVYPGDDRSALSVLTRQFFDAPRSFKVLCWVDGQGMPQLVPVPQCELSPASRAVLTCDLYADRLAPIPEGERVAVYAMDMDSSLSVLVEGIWSRGAFENREIGLIDITAVYNPMMPKIGYIYPRKPLEPVRAWGNTVPGFNV